MILIVQQYNSSSTTTTVVQRGTTFAALWYHTIRRARHERHIVERRAVSFSTMRGTCAVSTIVGAPDSEFEKYPSFEALLSLYEFV